MSKPITTQRVLEEDFFNLVGMEGIDPEEKKEMIQAMEEVVQGRVYLAICQLLTKEDQKLFDETPAEGLVAFLEERGIDLNMLVIEEAVDYRLQLAEAFQLATSPQPSVA